MQDFDTDRAAQTRIQCVLKSSYCRALRSILADPGASRVQYDLVAA